MRLSGLFSALLLASSQMAFAAPAAYLMLDHSANSLMDDATAQALWKDNLTSMQVKRLAKLYPMNKFGFATEVEGGFDDAKVCIVTARAMLLPRAGKVLVFKPTKTATAYGMLAGATQLQCQALAKSKLGDAMVAARSSLLPR